MRGMRHATYNRQPVKATICQTREAFDAAGPGAIFLWRFGDKQVQGGAAGYVMVKCPGCGDESAMHLRQPGSPHPQGASWEVEGLPETITFNPSVHCTGCCGWHGWLKQGTFSL